VPLGPVPYIEENPSAYEQEPRFVDAWVVSIKENQYPTEVFYNISFNDISYPLIALKKVDAGGLLVIGDSQFLLDENIEMKYEYWPGNIDLLTTIIQELQTIGVLR